MSSRADAVKKAVSALRKASEQLNLLATSIEVGSQAASELSRALGKAMEQEAAVGTCAQMLRDAVEKSE